MLREYATTLFWAKDMMFLAILQRTRALFQGIFTSG